MLVSLAIMLVVSGCGTQGASEEVSEENSSESKPAEGSATSEAPSDAGGYPIVDTPLILKLVMAKTPQQKKATEELKVVQAMEALTNIHIEWEAVDQGYQEKKNLMFASGDLPDAFFGRSSLSDSDILKYGSQGMLVPLEDLIEQHAPNVKKMFEIYPDVKKMVTAPDGHIYSIPTVITEGANELGEVLFVNKTWLDQLQLSVPTTTAEFERMLQAFKGQDLNGNGKIDELPFSFLYGNGLNGIFGLYGSFGLPDNASHLMVQDDKVSYIAATPEFKEATKYFHTLYSQGLIDPEAFTHDRNVYFSKGRGTDGPVYGAFTGYNAENVVGPDHAKHYVPIAPLKGPEGHQIVNMYEKLAVSKAGFSITSNNEHPVESMRWIDAIYEERHSIEWLFGPVGHNFKETDGDFYEFLPTPEGMSYDDFRCTESPCFGGAGSIPEDTYKKIELADKIKTRLEYLDIYQSYMKKYTLPAGMFFTIEDSDRLSILDTDITEFVKKKQAQWMIDGNIDAEWDSYLAQLQKSGLEEFLQIYQQTYDRFQSQ